MIRATVRQARKWHRCGSCGNVNICPGERYLEHVASPGHYDFLDSDRWQRMAECGGCADRYGRPIAEMAS